MSRECLTWSRKFWAARRSRVVRRGFERPNARLTTRLRRVQKGTAPKWALPDVTNVQSVQDAAREVSEKVGPIHALTTNAGTFPNFASGAFSPSALAPDVLRSTYETNFFGAFTVLQMFLPLLLKSEAPRVVNVSSTLGSLSELSNPQSGYYGVNAVAYNSSKSALNGLTVAFAKEFKDTPLKINSACPVLGQNRFGHRSGAAPTGRRPTHFRDAGDFARRWPDRAILR